MSTVLALDLGKSRCRAALFHDHDHDYNEAGGDRLTVAGPGAPGLAEAGGLQAALAAVSRTWQALPVPRPARLAAVTLGAAGARSAPRVAAELAARLPSILPVERTLVCSDAIAAHAGAFGTRPGVLLIAGTGAVAVGLGPAGLVRVDGWGPLLGDQGGGGWIGLRGLRAALRSYDGRGPRTELQAAAVRRFGDLQTLPGLLGGSDNPARLAGGFAPEVARLAAAGDAVAAGILDRAVQLLAATAAAAAVGLGADQQMPVAVTGGLTGLGESLLEPLRRALDAATAGPLVEPAGDSLAGARWLAGHRDGPHEPYLHRHPASTVEQPLPSTISPKE